MKMKICVKYSVVQRSYRRLNFRTFYRIHKNVRTYLRND